MRGVRAGRIALATAAVMMLSLTGCGASRDDGVRLRMWAMGREGEVVGELVRDFEAQNPGIRVDVQQIPWSAAHEKLLTAHVGRSTPDVAQLGNTWVPEFAALRAIEPLSEWIASSNAVRDTAFFPGIWDTNVIDGVPYGIPWYVDTRALFYRRDLLARAGYSEMPKTWAEWRRAMQAIKRLDPSHYAIFLPTNEYSPWIIFGIQAGSPLLRDHDSRGAFAEAAYRRATDFYLGLFRDGLAPAVPGASIANVHQEFARGTFAMYITGPWQLGEFANRLPPELQSAWDVAPLPGPDGPGASLAGGSSLVLFKRSPHKAEAWKLIEFLSQPEQQLRFYHLTGDLPARRVAWSDTALARDRRMRAFGEQLQLAAATPKVPEWEQIAMKLQDRVETMVLGHAAPDTVLPVLDREVDRMLEKRRWLAARDHRPAGTP